MGNIYVSIFLTHHMILTFSNSHGCNFYLLFYPEFNSFMISILISCTHYKKNSKYYYAVLSYIFQSYNLVDISVFFYVYKNDISNNSCIVSKHRSKCRFTKFNLQLSLFCISMTTPDTFFI